MRLPEYEIPDDDPLHLTDLRSLLKQIDRYSLIKVMSGGEVLTRPSYVQHGYGEIADRDGGPALYTIHISGWHCTSWIKNWCRALDHVERSENPDFLIEAGEPKMRTFRAKVIRVQTENSIYELRY